jgi:hypothetical protein
MGAREEIRKWAQTLRQVGRANIGRLWGTVLSTDGRYLATIGMFERLYFLRAELNAVAAVLVKKGVVTEDEWLGQLAEDYEHLAKVFSEDWPELEFSAAGFTVKDAKALAERARRERWPP